MAPQKNPHVGSVSPMGGRRIQTDRRQRSSYSNKRWGEESYLTGGPDGDMGKAVLWPRSELNSVGLTDEVPVDSIDAIDSIGILSWVSS